MPRASELLARLEALPLLGEGLRCALRIHRLLLPFLLQRPEPRLSARAHGRWAEMMAAMASPRAASLLTNAASKAERAGLDVLAAEARLRAARVTWDMGQHREALSMYRQRDDALAPTQGAMTRAWLGEADGDRLLGSVCEDLPPQQAHDQLASLVRLADLADRGARRDKAQTHLAEAMALAERHTEHGGYARAALTLCLWRLRDGDHGRAAALARSALQGGRDAPDTAIAAAATSILLSLAGDDETLSLARELEELARRRRNPAMLAQARLALCRAQLRRGDDTEAIMSLTGGITTLEPYRSGASNLLRARLLELRREWGEARFEVAMAHPNGRR